MGKIVIQDIRETPELNCQYRAPVLVFALMEEKMDPAAVKYQLLKERGEDIDIVFLKFNENSITPQVFKRDHIQSDGIGALIDLMKKDGLTGQTPPLLNAGEKPNLTKRLLLMKEHLQRQSPVDYQWKAFDKSKVGLSKGLAFLSFTKEQTEQIKSFCKDNGTNINSLFLWAIDKVSSKKFLADDHERVWMLPVNIRLDESDFGNNVTAFSIKINSHDDPKMIYQQIRGMLKKGLYWGGRIVANLPKFIGGKALRRLTKNVKSPYFGIVTNLGEWDGKTDTKYVLCGPATTFCPITICLLTWNGNLSFSCNIHPSLSQNLGDTVQLLEDCKKEILNFAQLPDLVSVSSVERAYLERETIRF